MLKVSNVKTLTFDCYGTLIDWESGVCATLRDIYELSDRDVSNDDLINTFLELDAREIRKNIFPYARVLEAVADDISMKFLGNFKPGLGEKFASSVSCWPAFEETNTVLQILAKNYRLAIISNVDVAMITQTITQFDVTFDLITTSEQCACYKPDVDIFKQALTDLHNDPQEVVHVAEGLCEALPAKELGMSSIWVKRSRRSDDGSGAIPDATISNLTELTS